MATSDFTASIIPAKGFEDVCAAEVKEIIGNSEIKNKVVTFSAPLLKICEYIYRAHTPSKVLLNLFDMPAGPEIAKAIGEKIKSTDLLLTEGATFVVKVHCDDLRIERQYLEQEVGAFIGAKTKAKVDFKNPDITFFVHIQEGTCWLGIDLCGEDLGKRDYRIFLGPQSLKGHVAASLVRLSGYTVEKVFLDLFCRNGVIPIEAALMASKCSPHKFGKEKFLFRTLPMLKDTDWDDFFNTIDKECNENVKATLIAMDSQFSHISSSKKNAKLAGANKPITFSRTDMEFLDAKFGKHKIDCLVTLTPQIRQGTPEAKVDKILKKFFYQAEFVMKPQGTMVLITQTAEDALKQYAEEYKFKLKEERMVWQGNAEFTVLVFER